jgi:glycine cleavage system regulatory protein
MCIKRNTFVCAKSHCKFLRDEVTFLKKLRTKFTFITLVQEDSNTLGLLRSSVASFLSTVDLNIQMKVKVKHSHYRPMGPAQRVLGG